MRKAYFYRMSGLTIISLFCLTDYNNEDEIQLTDIHSISRYPVIAITDDAPSNYNIATALKLTLMHIRCEYISTISITQLDLLKEAYQAAEKMDKFQKYIDTMNS